MSSSDDNADVGLGPAYFGTPISTDLSSDPLLQAVNDGAKGGTNTVGFFNKITSFGQQLATAASTGIDAWTKSTDSNGITIYYMGLDDGNGNTFYVEVHMLGLSIDGSDDDATVVTNGTSQTINGNTYDGIGYKALTLSYKNTKYAQYLWWVGIGSGTTALATAVKPVLTAVVESLTSQLTSQLSTVAGISTSDGSLIETTLESAEADANTAIAEDAAIEVAEVVVADVAVSTLGFVGILLAVAAICIVLAVVLHNSHQQVRLYNFSRYRVVWSVYFDEGGFMQCPGKVDSTDQVVEAHAIDPVQRTGPPDDANPSPKVYFGDFSVDSLSDTHGLGYAIQLKFMPSNIKDPQDSDAVYKCTLMFDIPFAGDNSTSVTFDDISDLKQFYEDNEGVNKSTAQSATSSDSVITVTTTYDYLDGEHPIPTQSTTGYYYQSLIQITDTGLSP